jgi:hypothetical protein
MTNTAFGKILNVLYNPNSVVTPLWISIRTDEIASSFGNHKKTIVSIK